MIRPLVLLLALVPAGALAQSTTPPSSILLPPNPIDRATAASDARAAEARRAADANRQSAASTARTVQQSTSGPVPNSTFTDGNAGFGSPPSDPTTPR